MRPPGTAIVTAIEQLGAELVHRELKLVTAESCTGGLLATLLTDSPGSSSWFEGAFVVYSWSTKQRFLGVRRETLESEGAVSEATVKEMAKGALDHSDADIFCLLSSGISLLFLSFLAGDLITPHVPSHGIYRT